MLTYHTSTIPTSSQV